MTRAAFVASPGDPFVLLHFIHYFKSVWYDEVDKLYVCINSDIEPSVVLELIELLKDPKINISYYNRTLGHGKAINVMLEQCEEEALVLMEDDSIVFKKGVVSGLFKQLEKKVVFIGSPRMSCPPDVAENLKKEFSLDYSGWGDKGPNFWPCFFYISTSLLKSTTRYFGATEAGDTFVKTSIELRRKYKKSMIGESRGKIIQEIPQYHCSPDDEQNKADSRGIFDGECGYMHFGSLSSGIENTLLDERGIPLKERTKNVQPVKLRLPENDQEKKELTKRLVWWNEARNLHLSAFGEFGKAYDYALSSIQNKANITHEELNNMRKLYMEVINAN